MRTLDRFVLALFAAVLLNGSVFSSPPRHPGVNWAQKNAVNLNVPVEQSTPSQNSSVSALQKIKQGALSCKDEWAGSIDDLKALVKRAKQKYEFESNTHLGRNATMLIPANLHEMESIRSGQSLFDLNGDEWVWCFWDGWHASTAKNDDDWFKAGKNSFSSGVEKYEIEDGEFAGAEVVYDKKTGRIVTDRHMGTRNFSYNFHSELDVKPHQKKDSYKYVGILFETDSSNPNKYYIVNGQTGMRMTWREAEDFPTTLSDEWKDMGLMCVAEDEEDMVEKSKRHEKLYAEAKAEIAESMIDPSMGRMIRFKTNTKNRNDNSDSDFCKCVVPADRDFYCTKCGKMSSWLAPREDPEFLEFLNKGARK